MNILLVALGGFFGSITRYYISIKTEKRLIGTWIANITGSITLGFLLHFHIAGTTPEWLWLLVGVGFCGAYTTFSTFGNETLNLFLDKKYGTAIFYSLSTVITALIIVYFIMKIL
ncbi:fluoride efflux transporter CrcB [Oceanobacillus sp. 143]|jgi:fluoride exporter|uniref:Fluoride-specific ion channel FluC n=1 Tax=Oceanobacillus zhaokaii TaxID=2052660 RepID=A0A345PIR3_9BACI|nr:fluoride efflux transporter CrcB [Oceanobacillus zhaokaii]AXI09893.1 fluoride efflux transporter CrcB [Oceanobacillus zhaokaii]QGS69114.1 fluoride efflux transporter CrcB [Oceanobacillus sp. 143]